MLFMEALDKETLARIKELRGDMSQNEFAEYIHSSQANMSRLFSKGQASYTTLISIAQTYDVSLDWLLGISEKRKPDGRIPPNEMTYADIISIATYLYDIGAIEEGWYSNEERAPQYIEISDPVLRYLVESHFQAQSVDKSMREIWVRQQLDLFSKYKVTPWSEDVRREFYTQVLDEFSKREGIIRLLENPDDFPAKKKKTPKTSPSYNPFIEMDDELPF